MPKPSYPPKLGRITIKLPGSKFFGLPIDKYVTYMYHFSYG
jgi:hypothetical protein